jgi:hypothetical protein
MKNSKLQSLTKKTAAVVLFVLVSGMAAWSQLPPPPPPTPTPVPIDGGIIMLAAAGAAYGAKKVYGRKSKK